MAELKVLDEVGLNDTLLTLEPARQCSGRCTWCYVELNRKADRWKGQSRRLDAPPSFERAASNAFGADYDPTSFPQWALRNRLPINWAAGVEPFQDVVQARAMLELVEQLDLPLFIQTRGTHWREVWPQLRRRAGQVGLYVSLPSADPAVVKRFEPATPGPDERRALIEAAAEAGIPVMLAVAPYHPDWCGDLAAHVEQAIAWGASAVLWDPLHLNDRQRQAATDLELAGLACSAYSERALAEATAARAVCLDYGAAWSAVSWQAPIHRLESIDPTPEGWLQYRNAQPFGYHEGPIFDVLHDLCDEDDAGPVAVTWDDALALMELDGSIEQPFSWSTLAGRVRSTRDLAESWKARLRPTATIRELLRALWNHPRATGFVWRHPFARVATRPDGQPHLSGSGDVVLVFDADYEPKRLGRVIEDLGALDFLAMSEVA